MLGVAAIVDDILVYGRTQQEHNTKLTRGLDKCLSAGKKMDKLQVGVQEVKYLDGLKPKPSKVATIQNMEPTFQQVWITDRHGYDNLHVQVRTKILPTSLVHYIALV